MTIVTLNRVTFTQINSVAQRIQVFGGRIQVADSASPAADDWWVLPSGAIVDLTAVKFGRSLDVPAPLSGLGPNYVVTQAA